MKSVQTFAQALMTSLARTHGVRREVVDAAHRTGYRFRRDLFAGDPGRVAANVAAVGEDECVSCVTR